MRNQKQISIIGCGWLGISLAKSFLQKGHKVIGTTTNFSKIKDLEAMGIHGHHCALEATTHWGNLTKILDGSDYIVLNFPPKRQANIGELYPQQMQQLLPFISEHQKVIFTSSTSVYQNTNNWVNETLTCKPTKPSGIAVLNAEHILKNRLKNRLCTLRLAGLIGGERVPAQFLAGKTAVAGGNAPVNLIHRADVVGLIEQIIEQDYFGHIVNGCCDKHPLRKDLYREAALKHGLTPPSFLSDPKPEFKIISNEKSKSALGYSYQYDDPMLLI